MREVVVTVGRDKGSTNKIKEGRENGYVWIRNRPLSSVLGAACIMLHTPSFTPGSGSRVLRWLFRLVGLYIALGERRVDRDEGGILHVQQSKTCYQEFTVQL